MTKQDQAVHRPRDRRRAARPARRRERDARLHQGLHKPHVYIAQDNGKGAKPIGARLQLARLAERRIGRLRTRRTGSAAPNCGSTRWRSARANDARPPGSKASPSPGRPTRPWSRRSPAAELEPQTLLRVRTPNRGKRTKVATGYFNGVSFSPETTELVFGRLARPKVPAKSDIYRVPVDGGAPVR